MPTLVKKWNLAEWVEKAVSAYQRRQAGRGRAGEDREVPQRRRRLGQDARPADRAGRRGASGRRDGAAEPRPGLCPGRPAWLCASGTFDRIHPRDPRAFPAGRAADRRHAGRLAPADVRRLGPVRLRGLQRRAGAGLCRGDVPRLYRFVRFTYSLRSDLWLQYARSGDRRTREFAAATNRTYLDNVYSHWDHKKKVAGLPVGSGDGDDYPDQRLAADVLGGAARRPTSAARRISTRSPGTTT